MESDSIEVMSLESLSPTDRGEFFLEMPEVSLENIDMPDEILHNNLNDSEIDMLMSLTCDEMESLAASTSASSIDLHHKEKAKINLDLKKSTFEELPPPETPIPSINNRFHRSTEKEMEDMFQERQSKSTKRNTAWGMKVFQDWTIEVKGQAMDLSTVEVNDLANSLRHFYAEARPKKSEAAGHNDVYHRNTLINIRGAINRHLADVHRDIDIIRDKEFRNANGVLDGLLKQRARSGNLKPTQHKPIIEKLDLEKLSTYLANGQKNPIILRQNVWYNLSLHFVTRGMEFHHQLLTNSFSFHNDATNEYVTINHSTQQQNYQGGINCTEAPADKRMYSTGTASCPVNMLKLLLSKSDTSGGPCSLFTQYKRNALEFPETHDIWFTRKPLSKRTFSNFLSDICKSAGVVNRYTPHCLRATAIQFLNDQGHEARHIMYMSSHKSESSLRSYTRNVSTDQKKSLSSALSTIALPCEETVQNQSDHVGLLPAIPVVTHDQSREIAINGNPSSSQITYKSNTCMTSAPGFFSNATFHGCTINLCK